MISRMKNSISDNVLPGGGKFTENDIWKAAWDMANGVEVLNRRGIVHCDLKPENMIAKKQEEGLATPTTALSNGKHSICL